MFTGSDLISMNQAGSWELGQWDNIEHHVTIKALKISALHYQPPTYCKSHSTHTDLVHGGSVQETHWWHAAYGRRHRGGWRRGCRVRWRWPRPWCSVNGDRVIIGLGNPKPMNWAGGNLKHTKLSRHLDRKRFCRLNVQTGTCSDPVSRKIKS